VLLSHSIEPRIAQSSGVGRDEPKERFDRICARRRQFFSLLTYYPRSPNHLLYRSFSNPQGPHTSLTAVFRSGDTSVAKSKVGLYVDMGETTVAFV
jgi:hypothetical protein